MTVPSRIADTGAFFAACMSIPKCPSDGLYDFLTDPLTGVKKIRPSVGMLLLNTCKVYFSSFSYSFTNSAASGDFSFREFKE